MPHRPMALEAYDLPQRNIEYLISSCSLRSAFRHCGRAPIAAPIQRTSIRSCFTTQHVRIVRTLIRSRVGLSSGVAHIEGLAGALPCRHRRKQRARLGNDAVLELPVSHPRGALHRTATFIVVDASLTGCIDHDFRDDARSALRSTQNPDEGHEQWHQQRDESF